MLNFSLTFVGFLLMLLNGVVKTQVQTQPTRLTGVNQSSFSIPIAVLDQCLPYEEDTTFGIEFQLPPNGGGNCVDGLTICYPSNLATRTMDNAHSVGEKSVLSELFTVDGYVENECKPFWHVIKVFAEKAPNVESRIITISASLLGKGKRFEIREAERQFVIHLGNAKEHAAFLSISGQRIELDEADKQKRQNYKMYARHGAHLKEFVGFWALGLDMMPWLEDEMALYVNRTCGCTMEAWFIRPTDAEVDYPMEISTGKGDMASDCIKDNPKKEFTVKLAADHLILIKMLTNEHTKLNIELMGGSDLKQRMSFNISTNHTANLALGNRIIPGHHFLDDGKLSNQNGTHEITFKIALTEYSYAIVMGEKLLGGRGFYPNDWWDGLTFNESTTLQLSGKFLLLIDPPPVMQFVTVERNYEPTTQTLPYWERDGTLQIGSELVFRIKLLENITEKFGIFLLHNRIKATSKPMIGATVFKMEVRPTENPPILLGSDLVPGSHPRDKGRNISNPTGSKFFAPNNAYEIRIKVVAEYNYSITLNNNNLRFYKGALPYWTIDNVQVTGENIILLEKVEFVNKENNNRVHNNNNNGTVSWSNFTQKLDTLLNYDDQIVLHLQTTGMDFTVMLLHEALKWDEKSKIGDLLLGLEFTFNADDTGCVVRCKSYLRKIGEWQKMDYNANGRLNKNGQSFRMDISVGAKHYEIEIGEVNLRHRCPFPQFSGIHFPPWAVNHIRVEGQNMSVDKLEVNLRKFEVNGDLGGQRINHYVLVDRNHSVGVLQSGDLIRVEVPFSESLQALSISLYYEGIDFHRIVGKLIMEVEYDAKDKSLCLRNYEDKMQESQCQQKHEIGPMVGKGVTQLFFGIRVTDNDGFNLTLTNNNMATGDSYGFQCPPELPPWAVQYITVTHNDTQNMKPNISINCEPPKLCKHPTEDRNYSIDERIFI